MTIEELLLKRIKFIGDGEFILLGTPADLIKELEESQLDVLERVDGIVNGMYELSITDLELRQHQQGVEIPVLSKTELSEALKRIKEGLDTNVQNNS